MGLRMPPKKPSDSGWYEVSRDGRRTPADGRLAVLLHPKRPKHLAGWSVLVDLPKFKVFSNPDGGETMFVKED